MHGKLEPEERVMESQNYTVYSKTGCPYCRQIVQVLDHIKDKQIDNKLLKSSLKLSLSAKLKSS